MRTTRLNGKEVQKVHSGFMLLICKSLSWKSPYLLLTATRNVIFSSLIEDCLFSAPGLQYWRRRGDLAFPVLLEMGCLSPPGESAQSGWTSGLPLSLQGEGVFGGEAKAS